MGLSVKGISSSPHSTRSLGSLGGPESVVRGVSHQNANPSFSEATFSDFREAVSLLAASGPVIMDRTISRRIDFGVARRSRAVVFVLFKVRRRGTGLPSA